MIAENEVLAEIHRGRAEHARAFNYDADVIFAEMRQDLERLRAEGWKVVSFPPKRTEEASAVVREDPPKL